MAGTARPNSPPGSPPVDNVRQLQNRLWAAAKQSPGRRFHALYDRVYRGDVLWEAWRRVRASRGAAGIDGLTLAAVEDYGVERMLDELARDLRAGTYHPVPLRRVEIPDDFVVLCSSREQAEQAQRRAAALLGEFGLDLHPDKTRVVDLREGKDGFDFLGWHFRARMSGRLWEQYGKRRYYLHRWPSQRSMKRARRRVKALTGRNMVGMELQAVIGRLNPFLRGWGNHFRTGNAADKFVTMDRYVAGRLKRLLVKKRGRNLHAGPADRWTRPGSHDQGLQQLMGTIRYPKAA